ncbi:hypothetical protein CTAYLR_005028 [Chrysophaeum taylorii]|uniref:Uncharacterized protein n=1 Tax=Chrysophaeum taylorii TaxID=2483200 RepID=A0AAD7UCV6_9STRA|nr:hypothetical protein CTAYLR_005028 [Chrysophaeum taylorii]
MALEDSLLFSDEEKEVGSSSSSDDGDDEDVKLIPRPSGKPRLAPRVRPLAMVTQQQQGPQGPQIPKKNRFEMYSYKEADKASGWLAPVRDENQIAKNRKKAVEARKAELASKRKKTTAAARKKTSTEWGNSDEEDEIGDTDSSSSSDEAPATSKMVEARNRLNNLVARRKEQAPTRRNGRREAKRRRVIDLVESDDAADEDVAPAANRGSVGSSDEDEGTGQDFGSRDAASRLLKACANCSGRIQARVDERLASEAEIREACCETLRLRPHQQVGVNWLLLLEEVGVNGVLADEMGLGKTVQAIAYLSMARKRRKRRGLDAKDLVVAPASTVDNWASEFSRFSPRTKVCVYRGSTEERAVMRQEFDGSADVVITTYTWWERDACENDRSFFRRGFAHLVLDEGHSLKNPEAKRSKRLRELGRRCEHRTILSGTPIQNAPLDLLGLLAFLMPSLFDGDLDALSRKLDLDKLKTTLVPFVLRRLKRDVLASLPPKTTTLVSVYLDDAQRALYDSRISRQLDDEKNNKRKDDALFTELRKAANHPMLVRTSAYEGKVFNAIVDAAFRRQHFGESVHKSKIRAELETYSDFDLHQLCLEYEELRDYGLKRDALLQSAKCRQLRILLPQLRAQNRRVLLFSQWVRILDLLGLLCEEDLDMRVCRLDGSTDVTERHRLIKKFNNGDYDVFLLSTRAGGLGINLTAADAVILHDVDFNPEVDRQAEDRAHRIGQTKPVTVYRLVAKDTVDEVINDIATKKRRLIDEVMADADDSPASNNQDYRTAVATAIERVLRDYHAKHPHHHHHKPSAPLPPLREKKSREAPAEATTTTSSSSNGPPALPTCRPLSSSSSSSSSSSTLSPIVIS